MPLVVTQFCPYEKAYPDLELLDFKVTDADEEGVKMKIH
jgi:hypothetical protein